MQLYLTQQYCSRGVLSQFLDAPSDWRWCMTGDEICQVCKEPHLDARPPDLIYTFEASKEEIFTGPEEVLRQDHMRDQILDNYERDLQIMMGSCLSKLTK